MRVRKRTAIKCLAFVIALVAVDQFFHRYVPIHGRKVTMEVTAYCACQLCCSWKRNWLGQPVFASGPLKGKRKVVGVCADGTRAERGTVAADTRYYPFGTRLFIPGYGRGVVHDTGGAIVGPHRLDLFFPGHDDALQWGRQRVEVIVAKP